MCKPIRSSAGKDGCGIPTAVEIVFYGMDYAEITRFQRRPLSLFHPTPVPSLDSFKLSFTSLFPNRTSMRYAYQRATPGVQLATCLVVNPMYRHHALLPIMCFKGLAQVPDIKSLILIKNAPFLCLADIRYLIWQKPDRFSAGTRK